MSFTETPPHRPNIIIAGFLGSGHEQFAGAVARMLGYEAVTSYTVFAQNAVRDGDQESARKHEINLLNAMTKRGEPSVIDVRASTFCREDTQNAIANLGALTAYYYHSSSTCHQGLNTIANDRERAAAATELAMYAFENVSDGAQCAADVVVTPRCGEDVNVLAASLAEHFAEHNGLLVPHTVGASITRPLAVSGGATIIQFPSPLQRQ